MYTSIITEGVLLCADWYVHIQTIVSNRYNITTRIVRHKVDIRIEKMNSFR